MIIIVHKYITMATKVSLDFIIDKSNYYIIAQEIVKPYVEVTFGRERDRTGLGQGPHPHWNEEIVLPFQ